MLWAALLVDMNRAREALDLIARALESDPRSVAAHVTLGHAYSRLERRTAAIASFENALALDPNLVGVHVSLAVELHEAARYDAALASFDAAIARNPRLANAHFGRGVTLSELGRYAEALASYHRAIDNHPDYFEAHLNRGVALTQLGDLEQSLAAYDRAIALRSDSPAAFANRGQVLAQLQRIDEAIESCNRAIALDPTYADAYVNRGVAHALLNQSALALASYDQAIALDQDHAQAHVNRSMTLLSVGDLENGWAGYEWRWRSDGAGLASGRTYPQPVWHGEPSLTGKTILLYGEAGLGDTIQFCRYAPLVAKLGARVLLVAPPPLQGLLVGLDPAVHVVTNESELADADYRCPLLSLPLAFKTVLSTIPARTPYLHANLEKVSHWRAKLGERHRPRVGLVWSGGFRPNQPRLWSTDRRRNIPLEKFSILKDADIEFYSLQKGEPAQGDLARLVSERWNGPHLTDFTSLLTDFSDTAALIENLDLVISVDTSTAHLAGALGKPTWILNRFDACWRWLLDRQDTPWYPTVRLYRQDAPGDWSGMLERVRRDLDALRV